MEPATSLTGRGIYPEREDASQPAADRFIATLGFHYHNAFHRVARESFALADDVSRHAARFAKVPLAPRLPELRYRLRRDGLSPDRIGECLGFGCAAISPGAAEIPPPESLLAAVLLLRGGIAELADPEARRQALVLAAVARAIEGVPVHVIAASDAGAARVAERLRAPLAALGMETGCMVQGMDARAKRAAYAAPIVCGTQREIALDYLRDRLLHGGRPRNIAGALERLSGRSTGAQLMLGGLHCALVDEADIVLLDDAHWPLAISAEADQSAERLLYEQALELARALALGADYDLHDDGARLTEEGAQRIAQLISPLGGVWGARQRREELISLALDALYRFQPDTDYRVGQGRVTLLGRDEAGTEEPSETDQILQHLIEIKEGCRLSGRRDVLVRLSAPRFFRRYLRLAGLCADARGIERELWTMYSLAATRAGLPAAIVNCVPRIFLTTAGKRTALVARVHDSVISGESAVVAVRTPAEAQALVAALEGGGLRPDLVAGSGVVSDQQAIASLDAAGGVVLVLYPADRRVERAGPGRARVRLFVAELHDAHRHIARLAQTFAAEACEMLIALEEEVVARQIPPALIVAAEWSGAAGGELSPRWSHWLARFAQRGIERAGATMRQEVMSRDQYLDDLLAFSGKRE